jgi:hypothetical protein
MPKHRFNLRKKGRNLPPLKPSVLHNLQMRKPLQL